ncbi:MAG: ABC transporter substrate-binding protein [Oscillospiraceae bacterium]
MKITNKTIAFILAAIMSASFAGCSSAPAAENTASDYAAVSDTDVSIKKIRIGSPTADATALVENAGVALKLGYIEEELKAVGYEAELVGFGQGGTAINEALASDQVDAAFVGDIPSIIGKSNGLDIEVVANLNNSAGMGILVGNNSGITTPEELKGKKVVVAFGTTTYVYLIRLLSQYGMTVDDVELINDIANGGPLVASGDADALISTRAGLFGYQDAGLGSILTTSNDDTDVKTAAQFFFYANKSYIKENEDAIKAIIRALIRAKDSVSADPDAVFAALETEDRSAATWEKIYPKAGGYEYFEPYITAADEEYYNSTVKLLLDSGVITNEINASDFFTNEYTEAVYNELGRTIPQ